MNKPIEGIPPNDILVNEPQDGTTSKETYIFPIMIAANHVDHGEIKEEINVIQVLEDLEQIVEHIINMHATLEGKNEDFKLMEELTQTSSSWRIMVHQQHKGPNLIQNPLLGFYIQESYNQWLSLEDMC
eukprot:Gb_38694 [translate_table: standard]